MLPWSPSPIGYGCVLSLTLLIGNIIQSLGIIPIHGMPLSLYFVSIFLIQKILFTKLPVFGRMCNITQHFIVAFHFKVAISPTYLIQETFEQSFCFLPFIVQCVRHFFIFFRQSIHLFILLFESVGHLPRDASQFNFSLFFMPAAYCQQMPIELREVKILEILFVSQQF